MTRYWDVLLQHHSCYLTGALRTHAQNSNGMRMTGMGSHSSMSDQPLAEHIPLLQGGPDAKPATGSLTMTQVALRHATG